MTFILTDSMSSVVSFIICSLLYETYFKSDYKCISSLGHIIGYRVTFLLILKHSTCSVPVAFKALKVFMWVRVNTLSA